MTTGRINQVANPSSTRGEQARHRRNDSLWVRGPWGEGRWAGLPRGTPEERCCAARGRSRVPDRRGARGAPRRGLGRHVGRLGPGTPSLCLAAWPSRWCLGREVPSHTPLAHVLASLLGPVRDLSVSALDSAADQLPGAGRTTHRASSSLLIGVRSVDNYGGPAQ